MAIPEIIVRGGGSEGSKIEILSMVGISHFKSYVLSYEWTQQMMDAWWVQK